MRSLIILMIAGVFFMTGCAESKNTAGGAALGGIAGGIAGAQIGKGTGRTAAIIGGTLAGAALGGYVGSYLDRMDQMDRRNLNSTLETQPTGRTNQWNNPDTNTTYAVTPTNTYQQQNQRYCREYTTEVIIDGQVETAFGTACRMNNGTWEIVR